MPVKKLRGAEEIPGVLVIVDVQSAYLAALNKDLQLRIKQAVAAKQKAGWRVIYLCTEEKGRPLLEFGPNVTKIWKKSLNGGAVVHAAIAGLGVKPKAVGFCGVNTSACVLGTATDLKRMLVDIDENEESEVKVLLKLCGDEDLYIVSFAT